MVTAIQGVDHAHHSYLRGASQESLSLASDAHGFGKQDGEIRGQGIGEDVSRRRRKLHLAALTCA